ncbi:MAG: HIT family protein [Pedobacter sp.]|nr:HIT family protein [Chitinophagaceae bacterium]
MTLFSKIIVGNIPAYIIAENDMFIAFLDIFPVKLGHVLVVPKVEVDKIFDVPNAYLQGLLLFAKPIAKAIEKAYPCNRVNLITIGLEVPHAHVHLIPTDALEDMNLANEKIKLSKQEFIEVQEKIIKNMDAI